MASFVDFAALKERISVEDAILLLGLSLKHQNEQWRGPCPICKTGGDRALVITPDKNAFYCFGNKKGGDVIAFAAHIRECSVKDAAMFLVGDDAEVKSSASHDTGSNTVPQGRVKEVVRNLQPLSYLEQDHESVLALGLDEAVCGQFGAGYAPKGIMRGRLAIPICDPDGTLMAYCGRAVNNKDVSMIFPKDFDPSMFVFNIQNIGEGELELLRDPLEVMLASQNGIVNAISFLTHDICSQQLKMLADLMDTFGCKSMRFT